MLLSLSYRLPLTNTHHIINSYPSATLQPTPVLASPRKKALIGRERASIGYCTTKRNSLVGSPEQGHFIPEMLTRPHV